MLARVVAVLATFNAACAKPVVWIREHGTDVSREAGLPRHGLLYLLLGGAETIRQAIATVMDHPASDADVARVRARLAAGGWPLAKPEHFNPAHWP